MLIMSYYYLNEPTIKPHPFLNNENCILEQVEIA